MTAKTLEDLIVDPEALNKVSSDIARDACKAPAPDCAASTALTPDDLSDRLAASPIPRAAAKDAG